MSRYVCKLHVSGDKQYKPGDEIDLDNLEDANELVRLGYLEPSKTVEAGQDPEGSGTSEPDSVDEGDKPKAPTKAKK